MSKSKTVADLWARYRDLVIPRNAPAIQITESERAFYAGAFVLLNAIIAAIGSDDISEGQGVAILERMHAELETFTERQIAADAATPPPTGDRIYSNSNYTTGDPDRVVPIMKDIASRIGDRLPPGWGFNLLLFTFGAGGHLFYISNAERDTMIAAMREFIKRNEH